MDFGSTEVNVYVTAAPGTQYKAKNREQIKGIELSLLKVGETIDFVTHLEILYMACRGHNNKMKRAWREKTWCRSTGGG